jgi:AcrR family transcriptional regulator
VLAKSGCSRYFMGALAGARETRWMKKRLARRKEKSFVALESDPASKREILKAALSLFVRHGPSDPTAREIAAQAGYSNPAIFKYFRTKDKLALYLFKQCYVRVTDELNGAIHLGRPFQDNLKALLDAYSRIVEEDLDAFLFTTENWRRFRPSLSPELRERSPGVLLLQVFQNGKAEGVVAQEVDIDLLVVGVVGLLSQFARMLYFGEFRGPSRNWIASIERMIIKMCG